MNPQMHSHKITKCKRCLAVVSQCRCMESGKFVTYVESCNKCDKTLLHLNKKPESKEDQYRRIHADIAAEIDSARVSHGLQAAALATVGRLADARANLEDSLTLLREVFIAERNKIILDDMAHWDNDSVMGRVETMLNKFNLEIPKHEVHSV